MASSAAQQLQHNSAAVSAQARRVGTRRAEHDRERDADTADADRPAECHGETVVMALVCYAGTPERGGEALAPFRALAEPIVDMVGEIAYPQMYGPEDPDYRPTAVARTMFLDTVDRETATTTSSDAPMRVVQLRALGGAIARVAPDATAYAHRSSRVMANVASFYETPQDRALRERWVLELAAELEQADTGAFVNFLGFDGPERVWAAYRARPGTGWSR